MAVVYGSVIDIVCLYNAGNDQTKRGLQRLNDT